MKHPWKSVAALASLVTMLGACGGGGTATSGIQGTGFSQGTVTGFGSIFVNGVEYETTGASFTVNGESGGRESDLRVGMVVTVRGSVDASGLTGSAVAVDYQNDVKGPITAVDSSSNSFVVMGQTVFVDGATSLDSSLPSLPVDAAWLSLTVEVSGFRDAAGAIRATRVETSTASNGSYEVKGRVIDPVTATSFTLGTLTVTYSGTPAVSAGDFVEVRGSLNGSTLAASRVEIEDGGSGAGSGDNLEIEGFVTRFVSLTDFDVDGQRVTTNSGTAFPDGSAGIALNSRVEVEGRIDANEVLVAEKVQLEGENSVRITAQVTAVNASSGTLEVFGIPVQTGAETRFEDKTELDQSPFNLSHINVGDWLEVRGLEVAGPALRAFLLERDDAPSDSAIELRGSPSNIDAAQVSFELLGITVTAAPGAECPGAASCTELLETLPAGALLQVRGQASDGIAGESLQAEEIEVEEED